jgi:hypothetical protein
MQTDALKDNDGDGSQGPVCLKPFVDPYYRAFIPMM